MSPTGLIVWTHLVGDRDLFGRQVDRLIRGIAEEIGEEFSYRPLQIDAPDAGHFHVEYSGHKAEIAIETLRNTTALPVRSTKCCDQLRRP